MYTKNNFFSFMPKIWKPFLRLPLEIFVSQWFSIKYLFSEGGDFLRMITIALLFMFTLIIHLFIFIISYLDFPVKPFWDSQWLYTTLRSLETASPDTHVTNSFCSIEIQSKFLKVLRIKTGSPCSEAKHNVVSDSVSLTSAFCCSIVTGAEACYFTISSTLTQHLNNNKGKIPE